MNDGQLILAGSAEAPGPERGRSSTKGILDYFVDLRPIEMILYIHITPLKLILPDWTLVERQSNTSEGVVFLLTWYEMISVLDLA